MASSSVGGSPFVLWVLFVVLKGQKGPKGRKDCYLSTGAPDDIFPARVFARRATRSERCFDPCGAISPNAAAPAKAGRVNRSVGRSPAGPVNPDRAGDSGPPRPRPPFRPPARLSIRP